MVIFFNALLRWWARVLLPFIRWRVPVALLHGTLRGSGKPVRVLAAGGRRWTRHLIQRMFAEEPAEQPLARVPVWRLQQRLDQWQSGADLLLIESDRLSARLFLARDYLAVPPFIACSMAVPQDTDLFIRQNGKVESDFRRVQRHGFDSSFSTQAGDFDTFYDHYYLPYIRSRHGEKAELTPRWRLRLLARRGGILWITQNGERVAGDVVQKKGGDYLSLVTGLREGRQDLLKQGALAALYVHALQHARQLGCRRILLGGSVPTLHDGVLRYKSKWLDALAAPAGFLAVNHVLLLRWQRLAGPVAEFLSQTALIHHEQGGFSALWVFPQDVPLTAENLQREYDALRLKGLHRFRILLPGPPPPDFVCPPEVCLIETAAVGMAGAVGLMAAEQAA